MATFGQLQKLYPDWIMYDEAEEDRKEHIIALKARGKSAPKKKQSVAGEYYYFIGSGGILADDF